MGKWLIVLLIALYVWLAHAIYIATVELIEHQRDVAAWYSTSIITVGLFLFLLQVIVKYQ